ncbi:MAG: hypothetical protein JWQ98_441 [Chlorobi bacterium]|nr:hypothetical protein [Chlorobiota bacterium]
MPNPGAKYLSSIENFIHDDRGNGVALEPWSVQLAAHVAPMFQKVGVRRTLRSDSGLLKLVRACDELFIPARGILNGSAPMKKLHAGVRTAGTDR